MNTQELKDLIVLVEGASKDGRLQRGVRSLFERTLPHLRRFSRLELMYHAESDCHFLSVGVDVGDGLAVPVTDDPEQVDAFFGDNLI